MKVIRVDVDTQVGFAAPEGHLFVPAPDSVIENIRALVESAEVLVGSVDSHAYDAWEFAANGGPFPAHCVKGTADWLKLDGTLPERFRFVPMGIGPHLIGEATPGTGPRPYGAAEFSEEAQAGVGLYFEKEVYSAFANPCAEPFLERLAHDLGGDVVFQVFGYCTGGFCVDAFVEGLLERGYRVQVIGDATAAIDTDENGMDGIAASRERLTAQGAEWITTEEALA